MSAEIKSLPAARWNIFECARWIDTRDLVKVGNHHRVPSYKAIEEIEGAWRAGKISPSGEVDGAPRRGLTVEDAKDYSISLYSREGKDCGALGTLFRYPPCAIYPSLYQHHEEIREDDCHIIVQSVRAYPEALVYDRDAAPMKVPGSSATLRFRFILGMSFDRVAVMKIWPAQDNNKQRRSVKSSVEPIDRLTALVSVREWLEAEMMKSPDRKTATDSDLRERCFNEMAQHFGPGFSTVASKRLFDEAKEKALNSVSAAAFAWRQAGPVKRSSPRP